MRKLLLLGALIMMTVSAEATVTTETPVMKPYAIMEDRAEAQFVPVRVNVTVDYGSGSYRSMDIDVPKAVPIYMVAETVLEAKLGPICATPNGILSIGKYDTDLSRHRYWTLDVNGNYLDVSANTILREGDNLKLTYHRGE